MGGAIVGGAKAGSKASTPPDACNVTLLAAEILPTRRSYVFVLGGVVGVVVVVSTTLPDDYST